MSEVLKHFKLLNIILLPDGVVVVDFPESGILQGMGGLGFRALSLFARHTSHVARLSSHVVRYHATRNTPLAARRTSFAALAIKSQCFFLHHNLFVVTLYILRCQGIMTYNTHLWRDGVPPTSPLDSSHTSRICSLIEALLSVLLMICGGGLLRITDTERYAQPASPWPPV